MRKRTHIVAFTLLILVVLFGIEYFLRQPIKGFIIRCFFIPAEIKQNSFVDLDVVSNPNEERKNFYVAYKKNEKYSVKWQEDTIEGYSVTNYLSVDSGELTWIMDSTKNPFGKREYERMCPDRHIGEVFLGYEDDKGEFHHIEENDSVVDLKFKVIFQGRGNLKD